MQKRLGRTQQPALAGQRLGAAQTLPATARGFAEAGQRPAAGTLPAERRPSSADIREQLAQKPGTQDKFANKLTQPKPATRDVQGRLGQGSRDNALQGIKNSGQASRFESQTGLGIAANQHHLPLVIFKLVNRQVESVSSARRPKGPGQPAVEKKPQIAQRQAQMPKQAERSQALAGRERTQQQMETQRRSEAAKPNAFEGSRNARATQISSQRGASSQQRSANAGNLRASGGGGRFRWWRACAEAVGAQVAEACAEAVDASVAGVARRWRRRATPMIEKLNNPVTKPAKRDMRGDVAESPLRDAMPPPIHFTQAVKTEVPIMYREIKNILLAALISAPLFALAAPPSPAPTAPAEAKSAEAQGFPTPDDAAKALLEAARSDDRNQIIAVFGSHDAELLSSGDEVEDKNNRSDFVTLAQEKMAGGEDRRGPGHRACRQHRLAFPHSSGEKWR